jgi:hypothetical protein
VVVPARDGQRTLTSVSIVGTSDVYASATTPPVVVYSHDFGSTFGTTTLAESSDVRISAVAAANSNEVYAAGYVAPAQAFVPFLTKSTDGGVTWQPLAVGLDAALFGMVADSQLGLIVVGATSQGAFFARSLDRGATWSPSTVAGVAALNGIWVSPEGLIYAAGALARATSVPPDAGTGAPVDGGNDGGADTDSASGASAGVVVLSSDAGMTWSIAATAQAPLLAVAGNDIRHMVAVGEADTWLESLGAGEPWDLNFMSSDLFRSENRFTSAWVPYSGNVYWPYVTGGSNGLFRYTMQTPVVPPYQSSRTWATETLPGQPSVYAVTGSAAAGVWVVGALGVVLHGTVGQPLP